MYRTTISLVLFFYLCQRCTKSFISNYGNDRSIFLTEDDFDDLSYSQNDDFEKISGTFDFDDPTLKANMFEGDIFGLNIRGQSGIRLRLWKNAQVPYALSTQITQFHGHYFSSVGRIDGRQLLSLSADYIQVGSVIHEFLHALGFMHEQSRPDRDEYVKILWENVHVDADTQFRKYSFGHENQLNLPYDYSSIMHYGPYAFSRNGLPTIRPLKRGGETMGQREGLSIWDVKKLNKLYNCRQERTPLSSIFHRTTSMPQLKSISTRPHKQINGVEVCRDRSKICFLWHKLDGGCRIYPKLMRHYCPKTCNYCESRGESSVKAEKVTTVPQKYTKCKDRLPFSCSLWAKAGACQHLNTSFFMSKHCRASCGKCYPSNEDSRRFTKNLNLINKRLNFTSNCIDSRYKCGWWAAEGLCQNDSYVKNHCPRMCGLCSADENAILSTTGNRQAIAGIQTCRNQYQSCDLWAEDGLCENPTVADFVKERCPRACAVCQHSFP